MLGYDFMRFLVAGVKLKRVVDVVNRNAILGKILTSSPFFEIIPVECVTFKKIEKNPRKQKALRKFFGETWPFCFMASV